MWAEDADSDGGRREVADAPVAVLVGMAMEEPGPEVKGDSPIVRKMACSRGRRPIVTWCGGISTSGSSATLWVMSPLDSVLSIAIHSKVDSRAPLPSGSVVGVVSVNAVA
jgi:hypothetical protein